MQVEMPKKEDDESQGGYGRREVAPGVQIGGIEREEHCEEINQKMLPMIFRCSHYNFALLPQFSRGPDSQPQEPIGYDHHDGAEGDEIAIGD